MKIEYSALVIPMILIFMVLEYIWAIFSKKRNYFSFEGSISNVSIGIAERMCYLVFAGIYYYVFVWIHEHWALFTIPRHWAVWVLLLLLTDLLWYWYHRLGHEINIFWGAHIVHHQSEDFNFTTAARITIFQSWVRTLFWCMMPLIGFHPDMVVSILLVHGGYSFFTHTQMIPKLGFLEKILITPSHHRVHHASNEKYLDKNYGDVFVFWDKLFGTFQEEEEQAVYGLVKPLESRSFLWQHFHFFFEMREACREQPNLWGVLKVIFGRPDMVTEAHARRARLRFGVKTAKGELTRLQRVYLGLQTAIGLMLLFWFTLNFANFEWTTQLFMLGTIAVTLVLIGAVMEKKDWSVYLEVVRFGIVTVWLLTFFGMNGYMAMLLMALAWAVAGESWKSKYRDWVTG